MTEYKNFIEDFPSRCRNILHLAGRPALSRGCEVTLILMVASAGLVVPYERLKPDRGCGAHPSGDTKTFADAAEKLKSLLDEPFISSVLWSGPSSTWFHGKLVSLNGHPESWEGLQKRKPLSREKKVGTVVKIIRNALAHANICTFKDPIEAIIFINSNLNGDHQARDYSFIYVVPKDFQKFLENWFDFLKDFHIPQEAAFEVLKDAA